MSGGFGPLLVAEDGTPGGTDIGDWDGGGSGGGSDGGGDSGGGGEAGGDLDDFIRRLQSLGYEFDKYDAWLLSYLKAKVEQEIKTFCNLPEVPEELYRVEVDRVCGEFLMARKTTGELRGIGAAGLLKSITEGDTSLTYAVADGEAITLDGVIRLLVDAGKTQLISFRRLRW